MSFLGKIVSGGLGLLGLGTSLLSGEVQRKSASQASDAAALATKYGVDAQTEMFNKSIEQFKPFYEAGKRGVNKLEQAKTGAQAPILPSTEIPFVFDPNDKMYKIQQEEGERSINRALAARGMYNSRPGINALADFNRKLIAEETGRQYGRAVDKYGRDYTSAIDKFNIENKIAGQEYGKYLDLAKIGTGAAGSMGQSALQTGQGVASQYQSLGNTQANALYRGGQAQAGMWQDVGSIPTNTLAQYYYGKKAGLWGG